MRSILLAGATGLVGRHCLALLAADPAYDRVVAVARRPHPAPAALRALGPRVEWHVVDFDHLDAHAALFRVDQLLCTLGTTIRAAGSQAQFRRVDHDYPLALARLGAAQGAHHFLLVSALGADARSRFFYSRVKGELEDALRALPYRAVTVVRPSLLLGDREERRAGEHFGQLLGRVLGPAVPSRYRPIRATAVAQALVRLAKADAPGWHVVESEEIGRVGSEEQGAGSN